MLNGEMAAVSGRGICTAVEIGGRGDDRVKEVERAYRLVAGRSPTNRESQVALEFLKDQPLEEFALAMFNLNAFLYVD